MPHVHTLCMSPRHHHPSPRPCPCPLPTPLAATHLAPTFYSPDDQTLHHLAGGLEWDTAARAPSYIALELDGSKTTNAAGGLVGAAGPYVVQFAGVDDSDTPQSKTKYVACGTDSCYFSSTEMFTLKPSSECATPSPFISRPRSKPHPCQRMHPFLVALTWLCGCLLRCGVRGRWLGCLPSSGGALRERGGDRTSNHLTNNRPLMRSSTCTPHPPLPPPPRRQPSIIFSAFLAPQFRVQVHHHRVPVQVRSGFGIHLEYLTARTGCHK